MATEELTIYCAQKFCCTIGDSILLWVTDPSLLAINVGVPDPADYTYIVPGVITEDICINATTHQYTVEYDGDLLTDPMTPLVQGDLFTYCCGSCSKQYVDEQMKNFVATATVSTDLSIDGDGSIPTPLSVVPSVDAGNELILGTDGKIFVPYPTINTDATLSGDGTVGTPLSLEFSADVGNRATVGTDSKLYVPPAMIAALTDNSIDGSGIAGDVLSVIPSTDALNQLILGTDGKLYIEPTVSSDASISGDGSAGNPLSVAGVPAFTDLSIDGDGTFANPLLITPSAVVGNIIVIAADGKIYAPAPTVSTTTSVDGDGSAGSPLDVPPSTDANNYIVAGTDGKLYAPIPAAGGTTWNIETLAANRQLVVSTDDVGQLLDPNGSDRTIEPSVVGATTGDQFKIVNNGVDKFLNVRKSIGSGSNIAQIGPGGATTIIFDGTDWTNVHSTESLSNTPTFINYGNDNDLAGSAQVCIGLGNTADFGFYNTIVGHENYVGPLIEYGLSLGYGTQVRENHGVALGSYARAERWGEVSIAIEKASNTTRSIGTVGYLGATSDATPTEIFLNGVSSERLDLYDTDQAVAFDGVVLAVDYTNNKSARWTISGLIARHGGTVALVQTADVTQNKFDVGMDSCVVAVTADDVNKALAITVTGLAGEDIRWTAKVDIVEDIDR